MRDLGKIHDLENTQVCIHALNGFFQNRLSRFLFDQPEFLCINVAGNGGLYRPILVPGMALRFTPPAEEAKKPSAGLVGALLPRPPSSSAQQRGDIAANKKQQHVWTLKNGQLSAIPVTIGSTDGSMTEVVSGDIEPGMALVVDTVSVGRGT